MTLDPAEELVISIKQNLSQVSERINAAAGRSGRQLSDVKLVLVTKAQPIEVLIAAYAAGARRFGENYAELAIPKIKSIGNAPGVEWHMIGHIQGRKAGLVIEFFDYVHSVDSLKIAEKLDRLASESKKVIPILLELNLGGEESKSGWQIQDDGSFDAILLEIERVAALQNLRVQGLMTMPPLFGEPESARQYFRRLKTLRDRLAKKIPSAGWHELSMGTSTDFEIAIEEGATFVRVGQAVLGLRPPRR